MVCQHHTKFTPLDLFWKLSLIRTSFTSHVQPTKTFKNFPSYTLVESQDENIIHSEKNLQCTVDFFLVFRPVQLRTPRTLCPHRLPRVRYKLPEWDASPKEPRGRDDLGTGSTDRTSAYYFPLRPSRLEWHHLSPSLCIRTGGFR